MSQCRAFLWRRGGYRNPDQGENLRVGYAGFSHRYKSEPIVPPTREIDLTLVGVVSFILAWSIVMVYSASIAMGDNPRFGGISNQYFLFRHVASIAIGLFIAALIFQIEMEQWQKYSRWLLFITVVLLILVLIPGVGISVNGARRWLPLGVMRFQPSELAKLAIVMYGASYMYRHVAKEEGKNLGFLKVVLPIGFFVAIVGMLLLLEPDMGAFIVVAIIAVGIVFISNVNIKGFLITALFQLVGFALIILTSPWRRERFFAYLDPWSEDHRLDKGYQLSHSLIAIGRGEISGVGLGNSVEKLHWLPEAHTDFLMAVIGEELGLIGIAVLLWVFYWLVYRIIKIGRRALYLEHVFSGFVAHGIGIWIGLQTFINIGVNVGALPTKGLTLPLMSFGGSAILLNLVAIAVVLRIDYENRSWKTKY